MVVVSPFALGACVEDVSMPFPGGDASSWGPRVWCSPFPDEHKKGRAEDPTMGGGARL